MTTLRSVFTLLSVIGLTAVISQAASPNLKPYRPNGWSDKIVLSRVTGTTTDAEDLRPTDSIYVDWALVNNGKSATSVGFITQLILDGEQQTWWLTSPPLLPDYQAAIEDYPLGSLAAGKHTITIKVDAFDVISESNEDDNEDTRTILIENPGTPNFAPYRPRGWSHEVVVSREAGTHSDSDDLRSTDIVYVDWAVENNGNGPASDSVGVQLFLDGLFKEGWLVDPLGEDSFSTLSDYRLGSLDPGTHTIVLKIDPQNFVAESKENDNEFSKTITVNRPGQPNLAPGQPEGWSDKIVVSRTTGTTIDGADLHSNEALYIDWAVVNKGSTVTPLSFGVQILVDGFFKEGWLLEPLAPNSMSILSDFPIGSLSAGLHTITVKVDSAGAFTEESEDDNEYTRTLTIGNPIKPSYSISVSAGENGVVDPSGVRLVEEGGEITLTATPFSEFRVKYWIVDGVDVGEHQLQYTLSSISNNHAIMAVFERVYFVDIQIKGNGGYSIQPQGAYYAQGDSVEIRALPADGYEFSEWRGAIKSRSPNISYTIPADDSLLKLYFAASSTPPSMHLAARDFASDVILFSIAPQLDWITFYEHSTDRLNWIPLYTSEPNSQPQNEIRVIPSPERIGFVRGTPFPVITTDPFLDFPIQGVTAATAEVSAVMDHERMEFKNDKMFVSGIAANLNFNHDNVIKTISGRYYSVPKVHRKDGEYYVPLQDDDSVSSLFNYVGYGPQGGAKSLQYDGHPGYDFNYHGKDVYAAAFGEVLVDDDLVGTNLENTGIAETYMSKVHALIIYHRVEGYCTVYMHLSEVESSYVDKMDPNHWRPVKASIDMTKRIGVTGSFCECRNSVGEHLHFEVWRRDGNEWNYADPYGEPIAIKPINRLWK